MKWLPGLFLLSMGFAVVSLSGSAQADSAFWCASRLVRPGEHMLEVRNKCGDPDMITQRVEKRTVTHKVRRWVKGEAEEIAEEREIEVLIDEWVYDLGPERFIRLVAFENSRVTCVGTSGYGGKR